MEKTQSDYCRAVNGLARLTAMNAIKWTLLANRRKGFPDPDLEKYIKLFRDNPRQLELHEEDSWACELGGKPCYLLKTSGVYGIHMFRTAEDAIVPLRMCYMDEAERGEIENLLALIRSAYLHP